MSRETTRSCDERSSPHNSRSSQEAGIHFHSRVGVGSWNWRYHVFSVVDRILFRSLPYPQEERLVSLGLVAPIEPQEFILGADYVEWWRQQTPMESLTSWSGVNDCDLTDGTPMRARRPLEH